MAFLPSLDLEVAIRSVGQQARSIRSKHIFQQPSSIDIKITLGDILSSSAIANFEGKRMVIRICRIWGFKVWSSATTVLGDNLQYMIFGVHFNCRLGG